MKNPKIGDIVEMDYQQNVSYVKGFSHEMDMQKKNRLIFIHHEWDSQKHKWLSVARERLRYVGRKMKSKLKAVGGE